MKPDVRRAGCDLLTLCEASSKIAAVLGARDQGGQVKSVRSAWSEQIGTIAIRDRAARPRPRQSADRRDSPSRTGLYLCGRGEDLHDSLDPRSRDRSRGRGCPRLRDGEVAAELVEELRGHFLPRPRTAAPALAATAD